MRPVLWDFVSVYLRKGLEFPILILSFPVSEKPSINANLPWEVGAKDRPELYDTRKGKSAIPFSNRNNDLPSLFLAAPLCCVRVSQSYRVCDNLSREREFFSTLHGAGESICSCNACIPHVHMGYLPPESIASSRLILQKNTALARFSSADNSGMNRSEVPCLMDNKSRANPIWAAL